MKVNNKVFDLANIKTSKRLIPLLMVIVLACACISVSAAQSDENTIKINYYGTEKEVVTKNDSLADILLEQGIVPDKNDKVTFSEISDHKGEIVIKKRYEVVIVKNDITSNFLIENSNVSKAIQLSGIEFNPSAELLNYEPSTEINKDITIEITVKPEPTPEPTPEPKKEVKTVKAKSTSSKATVNYESSQSEDNFIIINGEKVSYSKKLDIKGTAYTYGDDGGKRTCLGKATQRGIVAVDPRVIPLGTKLYVRTPDGSYEYGYAVAGDTGGAIKGNRMDIFVETAQEAYNFGRRNLEVYILD